MTQADDLGRVVIPKEIRRTLHIREGDPLEIFTMEDGSIILKKYSALGELTDFASGYAESLAKASGHPTFITDRDAIVAVSGASKRDFLSKRISRKLENLMEERSTVVVKSKSEGLIPIVEDDEHSYTSQVITPIIVHGDAIGSVIIFEDEGKTPLGELEKKLTQSAAGVLEKQLEQ